jgi:hypothetical protein
MHGIAVFLGVTMVWIALRDAFETTVLPRSVTRRLRLARLYFMTTWRVLRAIVRRFGSSTVRERFLGAFGPLALIGLIVVWATLLILGFSLLVWGIGSPFVMPAHEPHSLWSDIYTTGTTFFTASFGDIAPRTGLARFLTVAEAGTGLGFLAIVIGYFPVLYQSFSRREAGISRLDARAGSPPSAVELLRRHAEAGRMDALAPLLDDWERWAADVLESHLSYPVLTYYRSQHDRESWLAALTAILDVCALIQMGFEGDPEWQDSLQWQARMTFAMARHTMVDLALVLIVSPQAGADRMGPEDLENIRELLKTAGLSLRVDPDAQHRLNSLRAQYEPFLDALGSRLWLDLPVWSPQAVTADNWQVSAWDLGSHLSGHV